MPPDEPKDPISNLKRNYHIALGLARVLAFPVVLWTTRLGTWGTRYLTAAAVAGSFWPLVFASVYGPHPQVGEVFQFWLLSLVLLLAHRLAGRSRRARGYRCHSKFWGYSWLVRGTGLSAQRQARYADDVLVFAFGWWLSGVGSAPLGTLFMIGSVAKLVTDVMEYQAIEARLQQMDDARIGNEFYADLYRERQQRSG